MAEGDASDPATRAGPDRRLIAHSGRAGPTLVAMDNCEHVLDTVAPLVHRIFGIAPAVSVLATGRKPSVCRANTCGGWRRSPLLPEARSCPSICLDAFDAVALFVEPAQQARPNFVVDQRSAPHIGGQCARLDGIALAIELAAARTRSMPMDRLAAGLDDAFRLLTGGPRILVPRQQTLLASIGWSYDLLDDTDQAVLCRLAVCPARFDVDAAEAIAAGGPVEAMEVLGQPEPTGRQEPHRIRRRHRPLPHAGDHPTVRPRAARQRRANWSRPSDDTPSIGPFEQNIAASPRYDLVALREALTDVMAMLRWAMAREGDLAEQVLSSIAIATFGLNRWPEANRACDWLLARDPVAATGRRPWRQSR